MPPAVPRWDGVGWQWYSGSSRGAQHIHCIARNEQSWPSTEELTLAPEEQIKVRFLGIIFCLAGRRRWICIFLKFVIWFPILTASKNESVWQFWADLPLECLGWKCRLQGQVQTWNLCLFRECVLVLGRFSFCILYMYNVGNWNVQSCFG